MDETVIIVTGEIEGNYFTSQKLAYAPQEEYNKSVNKATLYKGIVKDAIIKESTFSAWKQLVDSTYGKTSLYFYNVDNLSVFPQINSQIKSVNNKVFSVVAINNSNVLHSWPHEKKLYGIVKGDFLGIIKNKDDDTVYPPIPKIPPGPQPPEPPGGCLKFLSNIWSFLRINCAQIGCLLFLLPLLYFLFSSLRQCNTNNNCTSDFKNYRDSLLQNKFKALSTSIYYYGNTTKIRELSKEKLKEIAAFLKQNPQIKVQINGYMNGDRRTFPTLDYDRAVAAKRLLIQYGVSENQIIAKGKGTSRNDKKTFDSVYVDDKVFFFNRNMRSDLIIINNQ